MMKLNMSVSTFCFLVFFFIETPDVSVAEALVLLSVLFFVPNIFPFVFYQTADRLVIILEKTLMRFYPIAAVSASLAFLTDAVLFALIWWAYTSLLAAYGVIRLRKTKIHRIEETSIYLGLIYLFMGGFWFFAYTSNMNIMNFSRLIILLTAVHFHYSAFLIPIFNGLLGRKIRVKRRLYLWVTWTILLSPMLIAAGISFSKILDFIAVSLYMIALYVNGYLVFHTPFHRKLAKILVAISAIVLMIMILFSLIYSFGVFQEKVTLSISQMIWIHGFSNAVGVITPALFGWRLENPQPTDNSCEKPFSRIYGKWKIGKGFLKRNDLETSDSYSGLVENMKNLESKDFSTENLPLLIKEFYEQTNDFRLKAKVTWATWFKPFAFIYNGISKRTGQIHLSMNSDWYMMHSEITGVDSQKDGREKVRAWIRTNEKDETIFTALYSLHKSNGTNYMNISLPLPFSNMTGILKPYPHSGGMTLTSKRRRSGAGDEGIYLHTACGTIPLPLSETFYIEAKGLNRLTATHHMWIFGFKFLFVQYEIEKK